MTILGLGRLIVTETAIIVTNATSCGEVVTELCADVTIVFCGQLIVTEMVIFVINGPLYGVFVIELVDYVTIVAD